MCEPVDGLLRLFASGCWDRLNNSGFWIFNYAECREKEEEKKKNAFFNLPMFFILVHTRDPLDSHPKSPTQWATVVLDSALKLQHCTESFFGPACKWNPPHTFSQSWFHLPQLSMVWFGPAIDPVTPTCSCYHLAHLLVCMYSNKPIAF